MTFVKGQVIKTFCQPGCTCGRHRSGGLSYTNLHRRVYAARGSASAHQCVRCPKQAKQWAQIHTEDGTDPWADYVPMCVGCHHRYDMPADQRIEIARRAAQARWRKA